ncbi:MAG: NAD(P)-dependent oxidoreductase [Planctomycetes bacterium]|nr:NAD(P)-dependent oxidoreductase [Planctomycetota bacterium]
MPESPELSDGLLITGATGFLGGAVVRALLRRGVPPARMRIVVRDLARAAAAGLPAASLVRGDLGDAAAERELAAAATGVGAVLHCAGSLKAWGCSGYREVNVGGTERLLRAVGAASPGAHVVFVSSLAAAGPSIDGTGSAAPPSACRPVSAYGASKRDAERIVAATAHWTIVRPPVVYGPGDAATRLLFRQANAPLATVPPNTQPLSVIHVDDVVDALLAAVVRRPHGAVLPLDGPERTDTHAFVRAIAAACGRRARLVRIPLAIAAAAAVVSDGFARMTGTASFFNRDKVRELRADGWVADGAAARALLGFAPRVGLHEGLARVAVAEGFVRGSTSATA